MGESIWCDVHVAIPADWLPVDALLVAESRNRYIPASELYDLSGPLEVIAGALINGEMSVMGSDEFTLIVQISGEGNYGLCEIEAELDSLVDCGVAFRASSDAKYEYPAELRMFDGAFMYKAETSGDTLVLDHGTYLSIIEGRHAWAPTVESYFAGPPALSARHLLGLPCPWIEDE